ncbi:MAG: hypothetical protein ABSH48_22255 [Verrucomicrobiota bacterium]|jgi:hypothetical protein
MGTMKASGSSLNFARWAITGVIAPLLLIVILRFAIAPFVWGPQVAAELGSALGGLFILWLLSLAIAATVWKIRNEKDRDRHND